MGLDISLSTESQDEIEDAKNYDEFWLSRDFCNFMCRQNLELNHEPELDQIGKITGIDISCIYEMEDYVDEAEVKMRIEFIDDEKERNRIIEEAEKSRKSIEGNIDKIRTTIDDLIAKLNEIDDLFSMLIPTNRDTLNSKYYFSDFKIEKGDNYIMNNFGQDLRTIRKFVQKAQQSNRKTVWFLYG